MIIKLDGQIVEQTDLPNTFSPRNHKPYLRPGYKGKWEAQVKTNKGLLWALGLALLLGLVLAVGCSYRVKQYKTEITRLEQLRTTELFKTIAIIEDYNKLEGELASCSAKIPKPRVSRGLVSFYSKDGCIGCNPNQKMANGQIFDENAMTLAHNQIPLNTKVKVINLDNGLYAYATVTDRGGFNKYNRIADLSKGLYEAINAKTDKSNIEIIY